MILQDEKANIIKRNMWSDEAVNIYRDLHNSGIQKYPFSWVRKPMTCKQFRFLYGHKMPYELKEVIDRGIASILINYIVECNQEAWAYSFPDIEEY